MVITYWLVVAVVACAYLQLIFGYICRWCRFSWPQAVARYAYYLSNLLNAVAVAIMAKERHSGVWILHLVALSHSLEVNDPGDSLQFLLSLVTIVMVAWRAFGIVSHTDMARGLPSAIPKILTIVLVVVCALWKFLASKQIASKRASKDVAVYMRDRNEYEGNDGNIYSYKYLVNSTTTVSDIYKRDYGERNQAKSLCLSFALFRLLFRRCQKIVCYEDKVPQTGALVIQQLISKSEVDWGFKLIEVELAFLHGYIHGGYILWSGPSCIINIAYSALVLKTLLMYVGIMLLSHVRESVSLFAFQVAFDFLQIMFYCNSNRWMVYHMCRCPPGNTSHRSRLDRVLATLNMNKLLPWNDYWQDRIGQLCLLEDEILTPQNSIPLRFLKGLFFEPMFIRGGTESAPTVSTSDLKARIARFLILPGRNVLDGVPSLENRQHNREVSKMNIILTWHIATRYCQIAHERVGRKDGYAVANTLSRYCAYLVTFRPKLIPDMVTEPMDKLEELLEEVRALSQPVTLTRLDDRRVAPLATRRDVEEGIKASTTMVRPRDGYTILTDGLNIGWNLVNGIQSDSDCWKILENIWIKLVLSIAIQDETGHMECLAKGGEFLTHLWAMLSHARMIEKKTWSPSHIYDHNDKASDFINELLQNYR